MGPRPTLPTHPRPASTERALARHLAFCASLTPVCGAAPGCSSPASGAETSCREGAALRACSDAGSILRGIDVSSYQASIDWAQVRAAGVSFAFARISDGTASPDGDFVANWRGMQQSGVVRGAYQYFRAGADPAAQAQLVATTLALAGGLRPGDLPVVMDVETADGQPESTIEARMRAWLSAVEALTGRRPLIYTSAGTYPVTTPAFASYALWVANYGASCPVLPAGWSQWTLWQTSSTGAVAGIGGAVDLDEYAGMLGALIALGADVTDGAAAVPPVDAETAAAVATSEAGGAAMGRAAEGAPPAGAPAPCQP